MVDGTPRGVVRDGKLEGHHSVLGCAQLGGKHTLGVGVDIEGRIVRYRVLTSSGRGRVEACKHRNDPGCVQLRYDPDIRHGGNRYSQTSMGRNEAPCLALEQVWVALVLV